ncbi:uncharacterized protein FPRO_10939 [Fusarium proliferatum ET1]|uniref:DUF7730 domain-containing protein n=1 Tax=Fusarium proliferatum (strain ET1) TaxID=1227346 RepID=A0A1L7VNW4_FUSPR|nr:uncharacterized protein FPRO_10939 [Fusarium proliferatum ET1]CZR41350.1 uncharacterized protein FPRO_10939 [Fusarium proliferatum ET1]
MGLEFEKGNAQRNSLFFTKLSPELRRQIFIYLFGESKVHIKFLQSSEKLKREGHPKYSRIPGWYHCVCRKGLKVPIHPHSEEDHKWCYLSADIIFTCKWAYQSGLPVLYRTNKLILDNPQDYTMFSSWFNAKQKYIRSISLHLECPAVYDAHEGLCHLSTALPESLLLQRLEVRMLLPGLGTHHGSSERDSQLMLRCLRMFLRGGLSKGKVELLALHLPEAMKEIVEGDKQVDATIWENVDCQFEQDNGPEGEEAKEEEDPESDDENHGLYIFPTQGDF